MSKKKKDKIEEQLKTTKEKPAKAQKKKGIVPASMPVLVPAAATEAPVPPAEPAPEPAAPKAKKAPAKKAPAKKKAKPAARVIETTVTTEEILISNDDIALRAYFISEARHANGHGGDETSDWIEAERQLRAEAAAKKK
jgi:hypothetical protein